jgi:phosphatidylserine/phosphatidylglycerophosphate/cardiolipin synthase-like enzyme
MTFSFTHDGIADELIRKKGEGLKVAGIVEKGQITKDSVYERLGAAGIDVVPDTGKELMHHKVFVIDGKIVITGSMNPTQNGDTKNNENILIVHSRDAAERFLAEFERLRNK